MIGWEATRLDELDAIPIGHGVVWRPVRRRLGIRAFGINAYTSDAIGHQVVEKHDETGGGAAGHEELYVVVRGRATFTIGGETLDAPAGTLVFIQDPALERMATSEEEGTFVLAIGGEAGQAYQVAAWESYFAAIPAFKSGRYQDAIDLMEAGLRERPGHPSILFNLACAESLAGRPLDALTHLREAIKADPTLTTRAQTDPDFDPIRREPGFPR